MGRGEEVRGELTTCLFRSLLTRSFICYSKLHLLCAVPDLPLPLCTHNMEYIIFFAVYIFVRIPCSWVRIFLYTLFFFFDTNTTLIYRNDGGVGNDGSADDGSSGGVDSGVHVARERGGGEGSGREVGKGGAGEKGAPAGGERGRGREGGGPRKYNIPSSELKKLDQLFLSEDDKLTYDRRQTPSYTAGT